MEHAPFKPNGKIASDNTNQDFNQRDGDSDSDRNQTGDECQAHPDRSNKPNILEHKKLLPAWKESSAHAVFSRTRGKRQTPLPESILPHPLRYVERSRNANP
jgi:hypothetical protein